jgi:sugar phosphate isomerase/epimerase
MKKATSMKRRRHKNKENVFMQSVELLAAYFTLAGDVYPFGPTEISPFPLQERARAASDAGYKGMGLIHADLLATAQRIGLSTVRRILDDNGIKHRELEFLVDWYLDGERRVASDKFRHEILHAAQAIGAQSVKIAPGLHDTAPADIERMRDAFIGVCQDAAQYGVNIVMEVMPFSNVRTLETALAIVQGADQANGGLLLDTWHIARGGIPYADIEKIPVQFIKSIEIDDAAAQVVGSLWEDTIYRRRLCGEGSLEPSKFVQAVQATGYNGPYGVEILSDMYRKLPLKEMARRSFETSMAQFASDR